VSAVIAAAGLGTRMGGVDKALVSVGKDTLIGLAVHALTHVGCNRFEVVCNEMNVGSVRRYLATEFPDLTFGFPIQKTPNGTAAAVLLGLSRVSGPCFVSWSDMFVRIPDPRYANCNVIYVMAVDPTESERYERVTFNPLGLVTKIEDRGSVSAPAFGSAGVFYLLDAQMFKGWKLDVPPDADLPFETLLRSAMDAGHRFGAMAAISFVDFGVRKAYDVHRPLFGDRLP